MVLALVHLKPSLGLRLHSANITVPDKVIGKVLALDVQLHMRRALVAAETTTEAFVSTLCSNNILQ